MNTQAFVYKWTHLPTLKWYVGSRTAKGCHINDGYICSSKIVKPMIQANPEQWNREIIEVGSKERMRELEAEILECVDAMNNPRSFNRSNATAVGRAEFHTEETKRKIGNSNKKPKSEIGRQNMIIAAKNRKTIFTEEHKKKISLAMSNRVLSEDHKKKIGLAHLGKKNPRTPEWTAKIAAANLGKKNPPKIHFCSYCKTNITGSGAFSRWHGNNCKLNSALKSATQHPTEFF